jgi:rhodanese-related sulfurtransferase
MNIEKNLLFNKELTMKSTYIYLFVVLLFFFTCSNDLQLLAGPACPDGVCGVSEKAETKDSKIIDRHQENEPDKSTKIAATVNTQGLKTLLDSGAEMVILDARSEQYDDGKRIPGAKSLVAGVSAKKVAEIVPDKNSLIITYCSNLQCPASHKLYKHLKSLGYSNVIEYPEGIQGWIDSGQPINIAK